MEFMDVLRNRYSCKKYDSGIEDAVSNKLDPEKLKKRIDSFICERKNCTLATGIDSFVRCTPIEYYLQRESYIRILRMKL